jgi:hypothetical protein
MFGIRFATHQYSQLTVKMLHEEKDMVLKTAW